MLLTKEQAERRLNSPDNLANQLTHENGRFKLIKMNRGGHATKGKPHDNYTDEERAYLAAISKVSSVPDVCNIFGVSDDAVWNWRAGRVRRAGDPELKEHPKLKQSIEDRLGITRDAALDKLMETLGLMSKDKISDCNAVQQSTIANNLSTVVGKTMPSTMSISGSNVVVYAPQQRKIKDFDIQDT